MAVRTDVTFNTFLSPRLVRIESPSVTITVKDTLDTVRAFEENLLNHDDNDLLDDSGANTLGGGRFTGRVATFKDTLLLFAPRTTKLQSGTVTTADTRGVKLKDSSALFQTNNVAVGDFVRNNADGSFSTVHSVISEIELRTTELSGGTDNQYDVTDGYDVFDVEECTVTDGDLIAIDKLGASVSPILPTFGTYVKVESSTSPGLVETGLSVLSAAESTKLTNIDTTVTNQLKNVEGTFDHNELMRLMAASLAGDLSGAGTGTIELKAAGGATIRIRVSIDANNNRTVTLLDAA